MRMLSHRLASLFVLLVAIAVHAPLALAEGYVGTWKIYFAEGSCENFYDPGRTMEVFENGTCVEAGLACTWRVEEERYILNWNGYPGYGLHGYLRADGTLQGGYINPDGVKLCWRGEKL